MCWPLVECGCSAARGHTWKSLRAYDYYLCGIEWIIWPALSRARAECIICITLEENNDVLVVPSIFDLARILWAKKAHTQTSWNLLRAEMLNFLSNVFKTPTFQIRISNGIHYIHTRISYALAQSTSIILISWMSSLPFTNAKCLEMIRTHTHASSTWHTY